MSETLSVFVEGQCIGTVTSAQEGWSKGCNYVTNNSDCKPKGGQAYIKVVRPDGTVAQSGYKA